MRLMFFILALFFSEKALADVYVSSQLGIIGPPLSLQANSGQMDFYTFAAFEEGAEIRLSFDARTSSFEDFIILVSQRKRP